MTSFLDVNLTDTWNSTHYIIALKSYFPSEKDAGLSEALSEKLHPKNSCLFTERLFICKSPFAVGSDPFVVDTDGMVNWPHPLLDSLPLVQVN